LTTTRQQRDAFQDHQFVDHTTSKRTAYTSAAIQCKGFCILYALPTPNTGWGCPKFKSGSRDPDHAPFGSDPLLTDLYLLCSLYVATLKNVASVMPKIVMTVQNVQIAVARVV